MTNVPSRSIDENVEAQLGPRFGDSEYMSITSTASRVGPLDQGLYLFSFTEDVLFKVGNSSVTASAANDSHLLPGGAVRDVEIEDQEHVSVIRVSNDCVGTISKIG